MSFYIVPSVLFQTQQKLKRGEKDKKHKHKHKSKKPHDLALTPEISSKTNSNPSSTNTSIREDSIHEHHNEDPSRPVNATQLSEELNRIKTEDAETSSVHTPSDIKSHLSESSADHLEAPRKNSTSTNASIPKQYRYRRNSSLSSHASLPLQLREREKSKLTGNTTLPSLSLPGAPSTPSRTSNYSNDVESDDASSKIFKPSYSMAQVDDFPKFIALDDVGGLNSLNKMQESMFSPSFQIFRFNNFLDILSGQHSNDPINFANIRYNSISKFLVRHSQCSNMEFDGEWKVNDLRDFEGPLAYQLISMRSFLRKLIQEQASSKSNGKTDILTCEELIQINFTNYMRFLLNLPQKYLTTPTSQLDAQLAMHQKFKLMFSLLIKSLHNFRKEETGDEISTITNSTTILLQTVTKVSYEYILLEKYHINILNQLSNNCLIDTRIVSRLFEMYQDGSIRPPDERVVPRVLVYNSYFSSQYSWYMAVTIPFLNIVELNIFHETEDLRDLSRYRRYEKSVSKISFDESEKKLFDHHFKHVHFNNFAEFRNTSDEKLVSMQRSSYLSDDNSSIASDSSSASNQHKPRNFSYFNKPLSAIPDDSFDVIQSRDLLLQLNNNNIDTMISEFYRILKVGGVLDSPLILLGAETIKSDLSTVGFPKLTKPEGPHLSDHYEVISNFAEVFISKLIKVFGNGNVKLGTVLLSSADATTDFLAKDIGFHVAEMIGEADLYCEAFEDRAGKPSEGVHFFFQIQATKNL